MVSRAKIRCQAESTRKMPQRVRARLDWSGEADRIRHTTSAAGKVGNSLQQRGMPI